MTKACILIGSHILHLHLNTTMCSGGVLCKVCAKRVVGSNCVQTDGAFSTSIAEQFYCCGKLENLFSTNLLTLWSGSGAIGIWQDGQFLRVPAVVKSVAAIVLEVSELMFRVADRRKPESLAQFKRKGWTPVTELGQGATFLLFKNLTKDMMFEENILFGFQANGQLVPGAQLSTPKSGTLGPRAHLSGAQFAKNRKFALFLQIPL